MAAMSGTCFNTWLSEKLLCINKDVDLDVFVEYITAILETDTSRDDKNESLEGIIGEILVRVSSPYLDQLTVVQCCTLYGSATHIANTRYRNTLAKNLRILSALVTVKGSVYLH